MIFFLFFLFNDLFNAFLDIDQINFSGFSTMDGDNDRGYHVLVGNAYCQMANSNSNDFWSFILYISSSYAAPIGFGICGGELRGTKSPTGMQLFIK